MRDKHIWIFNAGNSFDGNPKWLFLYITKYRKDITPYWFCYKTETVQYIKKLGYKAYLFKSREAEKIGKQAGVYVVNQKKEVFEEYLKGIVILNLWHGVGCKTVEKGVTFGFLEERIAKKTIRNNEFYKKYQLFLVTSPAMEKHFMQQCDVDQDKIIRAGYPCCIYPGNVSTYDFNNLFKAKSNSQAKLAIYAPTYRDATANHFFSKAIPDMEELVKTLEENNFVLIFKMHPLMEGDFEYQNIKKIYQDCPNLIFWNNENDIYEIFNRIELAIIDYSSIFYDMVAKGVPNFVRYIFDYEEGDCVRDFVFDYKEMTCGLVCNNFEDLLRSFKTYRDDMEKEQRKLEEIKKFFWSYSDDSSMERIINTALEFKPDESRVLPTLYSFDIFDTLIGRTTLEPQGVFRYVQLRMSEKGGYPAYVVNNFCKIRRWAEANQREFYRKSKLLRKSERTEITFDLIYERIQELYGLTDEQIEELKDWELECEYQTSIPYQDNIEKVKELLKQGETVVLISDMYLPETFIKKLLKKADPVLETIPLFLSSEYGSQKTTKRLFLDVYHAVDYHFGKWIHYGDNPKADGKIPRSLAIETVNHQIPKFNAYEKALTQFIDTYDAWQISALFARFREEHAESAEIFGYCYASLYFVPYVSWSINHALDHGIQTLYFISRDGHHLKRIADAIIEKKQLPIKTKYIYGSRKAWRIPSQIQEIDEEFFSEFGNFTGINTYEDFLEASALTEEEFTHLFPELIYLKGKRTLTKKVQSLLRETLKNSEAYRTVLLQKAKERRTIVLDYLKQEIDFGEKYAFVEFWGRGYTQTCLAKLIWEAEGSRKDNIFYYARSIYPSEENLIRYNFTTNNYSYIFIEAIFANLPYKSISEYENKGDRITPIIHERENRQKIHQTLEEFLPYFAKDFSGLILQDEAGICNALFDFGLSYFHNHQSQPVFADYIATLPYAETLYGKDAEFAPEITLKTIWERILGQYFSTKSIQMSLTRSKPIFRKMYNWYHNKFRKSKYGKKVDARLKKVWRKMSSIRN